MRISEIETPAIVVDLNVMERNLARAAGYAAAHKLRLRPHIKTHKSIAVAREQVHLGAAGLTVAKVGEAEVMLGAEPCDILLAYPVVGPTKLARLMAVARRVRTTVALDSLAVAKPLSEAAVAAKVEIGVLAELDAGLGRVGVPPSELLDLARALRGLPNLSFAGIAFYAGQVKSLDSDGLAELKRVGQLVETLLCDFRKAGVDVKIVSGGSTPALYHSHEMQGLTEIRPGTYVFNDLNTVASGGCTLYDCAASIVATVVSTPRPGHMVIDGGSKTFSSDRPTEGEITFGHILEAPGARFHKMNEEHGYVDISRADRRFAVGDRVRVIPNHICVAVNLHERVYGVRGEEVERVWPVDARGKLQ